MTLPGPAPQSRNSPPWGPKIPEEETPQWPRQHLLPRLAPRRNPGGPRKSQSGDPRSGGRKSPSDSRGLRLFLNLKKLLSPLYEISRYMYYPGPGYWILVYWTLEWFIVYMDYTHYLQPNLATTIAYVGTKGGLPYTRGRPAGYCPLPRRRAQR